MTIYVSHPGLFEPNQLFNILIVIFPCKQSQEVQIFTITYFSASFY